MLKDRLPYVYISVCRLAIMSCCLSLAKKCRMSINLSLQCHYGVIGLEMFRKAGRLIVGLPEGWQRGQYVLPNTEYTADHHE